jgi:dodecin
LTGGSMRLACHWVALSALRSRAARRRTRSISHGWNSWKGKATMSEPIYKVVEIVGTSEQSISKAIDNAIAKAAGTLRRLGWFEVGEVRGNIADGKVHHYQVTLKVGFTLE